MAVQTKFEITFKCGHEQTRDLSEKPAGKRKGFANWLSGQDCFDCWKEETKDERAEQRRESAATNAKKLGLPDLDGSEKQLLWAPVFRDSLIQNAHEELCRGDDPAMNEEEFDERIMVHARAITRAGWWMDNVDSEPEDLEELVTTALDDEEAVNGCENTL